MLIYIRKAMSDPQLQYNNIIHVLVFRWRNDWLVGLQPFLISTSKQRQYILHNKSLFGRIFTFRFWQFSIFENNLWNVQPIKHDKTTLSSISSENNAFLFLTCVMASFRFCFCFCFCFWGFFYRKQERNLYRPTTAYSNHINAVL